jgi:UDP-3-O-[3-hydroxymyristoyl] glucosamine N-acyltransferase
VELERLAAELGLPFEGSPAHEIAGLAGLEDAGPRELSFIESARYARVLERSQAGAVIAPPGLDVGKRACLRSVVPYADFARAIALFQPRSRPAPGVHPTAVVGEGVALGADVSIGAYCVLGKGASIGARSVLHPHVTVYPGVVLGADCEVHSGCALREGVRIGERAVLQNGAVIGSEGFGFALDANRKQRRVPHRCGVEIGDDVEIGANSTIDASHSGHSRHGHPSVCTRIGAGVKIDNQVQIAHGCYVESNSQLCAQVGLAGSTWVGHGVFMAGQAGAKGHVHIGAGSIIGGATGVTSDVEPGAQILGVPPGVDRRLWGRIVAAWKRLPNLLTRVRELEKRIEELEGSRRE